jgi:hypothetical protein
MRALFTLKIYVYMLDTENINCLQQSKETKIKS